ncbi:MAG TPA: toll/interleukin-1 receptor domain-containing protein [Armatimonadota bacterium]|nr:toll/interleukin-1 receptor domain-containing protein [Armatimonadota bacterium]
MSSEQFDYDVFISYSSQDETWVKGIKDALAAREIRVWLDKDDIRPGDLFPEALAHGIESSRALAIIISPEAVCSGWVKEEYSKALVLANLPGRARLQIIPVVLRHAEFPGFIMTRQWVDFSDEAAYAETLDRLIWGITGQRPEAAPTAAQPPGSGLIPPPPLPHFAHPYPLQKHFTGRVAYRKMLTKWLTGADCPIFSLTAIGGTGKSALAWAWVQRDVLGRTLADAAADSPENADACRLPDVTPIQGILWWSFYERESSFSAFLNEAIAYTSGGQVDPAETPSDYDKTKQLLQLLQNRRFLFILDGFERQLRAYTGLNAPYQGDVEEDERGDFRSCANPHLARFLQDAASLNIPSRLLLTTRHFPRDLDGIAGCDSTPLEGLDPQDAVAFFYAHGIKGNRPEIQAACAPYGYHPLALRLLAGLIVKDKQNPGDIKVAERYSVLPDLKGKEQHHIIQPFYDALRKPERTLLSRIAAFRSAVGHDALAELNPYTKPEKFEAALEDLIDRGFLIHDRERNRFDLHPLVRRYAYQRLSDKKGTHTRLRDYFAPIPKPGKIESLEDLAPVIELYHHTVGAGQYDEARDLLRGRLIPDPLYFRFGAYQTCIDLLRALFPDGEDRPPRLKRETAQAWTLNSLAASYDRFGQPRRAEPLFEMNIALREKADVEHNPSIALSNLAGIQLSLGRLTAAEENIRRSIDLCREIGDELHEAVGHQELGLVQLHLGTFDEAALELDAALTRLGTRASTQGQSVVSAYRTERALLMGDAGPALQAARRARGLADKEAIEDSPIERDFVQAEWLIGAALVALAAEEEAKRKEHLFEAEDHLTDALTRCRRINLVELEPDVLLACAKWHHLKADLAQARKQADEALSIADRCEYRLAQADCHNFLAALDQEEDDTESAIAHARTAYERAWCDGPPHSYKPALDEATRLLQSLRADPPPIP